MYTVCGIFSIMYGYGAGRSGAEVKYIRRKAPRFGLCKLEDRLTFDCDTHLATLFRQLRSMHTLYSPGFSLKRARGLRRRASAGVFQFTRT